MEKEGCRKNKQKLKTPDAWSLCQITPFSLRGYARLSRLLLLFGDDGARESAVVPVHVVAPLVQQPDPNAVAAPQVDDGGIASASVSVVRTRIHPGHFLIVDDEGGLHLGVVAGQDGGVEDVGAWERGGELACRERRKVQAKSGSSSFDTWNICQPRIQND